MRPEIIKRFLTAFLLLCSLAAAGQLPYSPCGPGGGKRADLLGVEARYSSPGGSAPVFNIPAGTKSISVYISSETGITAGGKDYVQGDEDFITVNAIIDIASGTSSGYVNYAKNTSTDGSGTNVYGWRQEPLGDFIPASKKIGDAAPDLNNVNFTISGNTLSIIQSATGLHSSYYVQYLSSYNNSLNLLQPQVKSLLHGTAAANTDLVMPIPAEADLIFITGKGTNSSYADLKTTNGSEEGYANLRFTIDLERGKTTGFVTLANGGSANRRSTYVVNDLVNTYKGPLISSGAVTGDYNGKSVAAGAVGLYNPYLYVDGASLVIKRDASYARDFDDGYVIEFYKRAGQGMSAEFINSDIKFIPKGISSYTGVTRTFTIPPGTNAIYFTETGNSCNLSLESNENSLEAYAYIDLATETATGYFYQQVGLSLTERRDDNFAFRGLPLNNSSARSHANTVGFKGRYAYDISFSLSPDKSQLTITNKTGLANPDYQILLSADYYGSKPDMAFNAAAASFTKLSPQKLVRANVAVCNPGAGNSNGGMPVSFYQGNPTSNPAAKLLYTGVFPEDIPSGACKDFSFDIDLESYDNLDIDLTIIINDDGSYVPGGPGHAVGTPFSLSSLAAQHPTYQECYYENNLLGHTIDVNNAPIADLDGDNSSGTDGAFNYQDVFHAGSTTGTRIADDDLQIIDPDATNLASATVTLTNIPDAGSEGIYLNGTLPAGISITGNGTNVVQLSGQAPQSAYIAALRMLTYLNSKGSPNTGDRIITTIINDGTEPGPASLTTIVILTSPRINVSGKGITIADNSSVVSPADGTDFGATGTGIQTNTFSIHNTGTGVLQLTAPALVSITGDGFSIAAQPGQHSISSAESTAFSISFDPAGRTGGTYTALVRIQNNDADADRADYTFTVSARVNKLPVLGDNSFAGNEDYTLPLTAAAFAAAYNDPDGDALSAVRILSLPSNGSLVLQSDPVAIGQEVPHSLLDNMAFVPATNWNGNTGFDWSAADGMAYSAGPAHTDLRIAPVNDAPHITLINSMSVTEDVPIAIKDISFEDIDAAAGNVAVTFTVPAGALSATAASGVAVSGAPGALILTGSIADINAFLAAGQLSFVIGQSVHTSVVLTVNMSDNGNTGSGGALQDTKTMVLEITAVNDPPTGTGDTKITDEDTPVDGAVTGADPDGDVLTFTKASHPTNGTVNVNPIGDYTYTPNAGYHGPDQFTVEISDNHGGTATVIVKITVLPVNDPPAGTGDTKTTNEDTPVNGSVTGTDPDADLLTFTKATGPANGSVVVYANGNYTYTPNVDYNGPDQFTINITDGNGGAVTVTVNIQVIPAAVVNGSIVLVKTATLRSDNISITYRFSITNTGNVPLHNVVLTDPMLGLTKNLPNDLQAGASTSITVIYRLTQRDREQGSVANTAVVTGFTPANTEVRDMSGTDLNNDQPTETKVAASPRAMDDAATTRTGTPVTIPVLDNDDAGHSSFNTTTVTILAQPLHGRLSIHPDGTVTYTPETTYSGEDNFSYRVQDVDGYQTNRAFVQLMISAVNIQIPTLFTPNSDGKNDAFEVRGLQQYTENELVIVNRWGNEVYRQKNYQNNWRGDGLNEGTYYYLLKVRKADTAAWEVFKGYTTLIRKFKQ
jgi:gliding motility-associated-like protein